MERLTSNVYLSKAAIIARFTRSSKSHDAVEWRKWMINNAQRCASYNHAASGSDQDVRVSKTSGGKLPAVVICL